MQVPPAYGAGEAVVVEDVEVLAQDEVVRVQRRLALGARGAEVPGIIITEPLGDF